MQEAVLAPEWDAALVKGKGEIGDATLETAQHLLRDVAQRRNELIHVRSRAGVNFHPSPQLASPAGADSET